MKRLLLVVLASLAIASIPAQVQADTITLYDWTAAGNFSGNAPGGGGPFRAVTNGALLGTSDFFTFCIEYNENFSYGTTYTFTLSDSARYGGVSGGYPYDPVSDATKWLYYQARSGGYLGWYGSLGLPVDNNVGANFQLAIWSLEGETTLAGGSPGALIAGYALLHENWDVLATQGHQVYAMNLQQVGCNPAQTPGCDKVQDQLAYIAPVPEPGSTMLLLGTGLIGLAGATRRWMRR